MTPYERAEIEAVARNLDALSLRGSAVRLRALVGTPADPERLCPVSDRQGRPRAIPWALAEILFPAYGPGQTLEDLARRGGFGRRELGFLAADDYSQDHPRLARPPLLDLYEMACAAAADRQQLCGYVLTMGRAWRQHMVLEGFDPADAGEDVRETLPPGVWAVLAGGEEGK